MSINDRLGLLCRALAFGTAGAELEPLSAEWVEELRAFAEADLEDVQECRRELDR